MINITIIQLKNVILQFKNRDVFLLSGNVCRNNVYKEEIMIKCRNKIGNEN